MNARTWHSGPPPHVGWWNANASRNPKLWRWFDGECWSYPAHENDDEREAARCASMVRCSPGMGVIEWSDYWPEGARVPRVDPRASAAVGIEYDPSWKPSVRVITDGRVLRVFAGAPRAPAPATKAKPTWWRRVAAWAKGGAK